MALTLASDAITFTNGTSLSSGIIGTAQLSAGAVTTTAIASGAITPEKLSQPYTLATAKAWNWNGSSSNTFIDFENIPSWAKRVTVMFSGVSVNGASRVIVQLGTSSGIETSNYLGSIQWGSALRSNFSTGFLTTDDTSGDNAYVRHGLITLCLMGSNIWAAQISIGLSSGNDAWHGAGSKTLSGTLDRIRITTTTPSTNVFDAGTINISYE